MLCIASLCLLSLVLRAAQIAHADDSGPWGWDGDPTAVVPRLFPEQCPNEDGGRCERVACGGACADAAALAGCECHCGFKCGCSDTLPSKRSLCVCV